MSSCIYKQIACLDAPIYFPLSPPISMPPCFTRALLELTPKQWLVHKSRSSVELHARRRATVQLVRALRANFGQKLEFGPNFVAPANHPRSRLLSRPLKHYDGQLQAHYEASRRRGANAAGSAHPAESSRSSSASQSSGSNDSFPRFCGQMLFDVNDEEQREPSASSSSKCSDCCGLQSSRARHRQKVVDVIVTLGNLRCDPECRQCERCAASQRFNEAVLAIRALVPRVSSFFAAFVRAVSQSAELKASILQEVQQELKMGYRPVYSSVLGLIREETSYKLLVDVVDDVLGSCNLGEAAGQASTNPAELVDLVSEAHSRHRRLQKYCREVARRVAGVDLEVPVSELGLSCSARGGTDLEKVPPLKGCWRILEKNLLRPELRLTSRRARVARTFDVARSTIVFQDVQGMLQAVKVITEIDSPVRVCRGKNRLRNPTEGGWADVLLNVVWKNDPHQHVMEVQFIPIKLMMIRHSSAFNGHNRYALFRAACEVAECLGLDTSG